MIPTSFMLIAGEASGDRLAAELVTALREEWSRRNGESERGNQPQSSGFTPSFFGAGSNAMREAGVEIIEDMSHRGVIGVSDVLKRVVEFAQLMNRLVRGAVARQPDVIICVDYGAFNLRFQSRLRRLLRSRRGPFNNWQPKLIQFVSPQVWGSRPGRAFAMERNLDLLVSILPFEKAWFAQRTPDLKIEFIGHPLIDRHAGATAEPPLHRDSTTASPLIALLPGSRRGELRQHLPVMLDVVQRLRRESPFRFKLVVPNDDLAALAREAIGSEPVEIVVGELSEVLQEATLAISKTGTITLELALFNVPAVTFYKTSWLTYWIARWLVKVKWLSMPNLLAGEAVLPEFVQQAASGDAIAHAALELLTNEPHRQAQREKLQQIVRQLGQPGAPARAASAIFDLFGAP